MTGLSKIGVIMKCGIKGLRCILCLCSGTEGVATDYQVKQLEQQIERLKEALVK